MPIPPIAAAVAQTPAAQQLAAAERDTQLRRARERQRTSGRDDQPVDEYVEAADTVAAVGDDRHHDDPAERKKRKRKPPARPLSADGEGHIDLQA